MTIRNVNRISTVALIAAATLFANTAAQAGGYGFGGFGGGMGGGMGGGRLMNQLYRGNGSSRSGSSSHKYSSQKYSSSKPYTPAVQQYPSTSVSNHSNTGIKTQDFTKVTKTDPSRVVKTNGNGQQSAKKIDVNSVGTRVNDLLKNGSAVAGGAATSTFPGKLPDIKKFDPSKIGTIVAGDMPSTKPYPGKVIDPGIGNGNPGPISPITPPTNPNPPVCGTHPKPTQPGDPNWNWVGVTLPVVVGHVGGGYTRPNVINNNTTVIEQTIVQAPVAQAVPNAPSAASAPDLKLESVSLVDQGSVASANGPTYRVVVRNDSTVNVDNPFTVTLVAAKSDRSFEAATPRTDEPVISLAAGQEKTLDIRLPVEALTSEKDEAGNEAPFATLLVLVDGYSKLTESNRDNNAAAIARIEIQAILPIVASAETIADADNRELSVAGQSFGAEQGKVLLDLGMVRVPAEVVAWDASSIRAKLPEIETAATITTRLIVVRADGTAAEPFDLTQTDVAAK